ncbi:MAG: chemotaxis protein CheW [Pseudomonadota bacterium]
MQNEIEGNAALDVQRSVDQDGDQYLTFMLSGEEYGIDILRVQEIKGLESVTEIPNTPEYVLGVINLRGTVIPVVDLRLRFGLGSLEYNNLTVVIVVKVNAGDKDYTIGLVVDTVSDVYNIETDSISGAPDFGTNVDTSFISGIATVNEKMVIVLDVDFLALSVTGNDNLKDVQT